MVRGTEKGGGHSGPDSYYFCKLRHMVIKYTEVHFPSIAHFIPIWTTVGGGGGGGGWGGGHSGH